LVRDFAKPEPNPLDLGPTLKFPGRVRIDFKGETDKTIEVPFVSNHEEQSGSVLVRQSFSHKQFAGNDALASGHIHFKVEPGLCKSYCFPLGSCSIRPHSLFGMQVETICQCKGIEQYSNLDLELIIAINVPDGLPFRALFERLLDNKRDKAF
jgi:hypothetical protein